MTNNDQNVSWKDKEPKDWKCSDYVSYLKDTGVAEYYLNFYNPSNGFRCPSIDISRTYAIENKWFKHKCKPHNGDKHSILNEDCVTATWFCPTIKNSTGKSQIPFRYDLKKGQFIPITFDKIENILSLGHKARIWHAETSIFDNKFRNTNIFPDKLLDKWLKDKAGTYKTEKVERLVGCILRLEFDTTKETKDIKNEKTGNERRDIMTEGDKIINNTQKLIDLMNTQMYERFELEKDDFLWWFSGDGLYLTLKNNILEEERNDKEYNEWSKYKFYSHWWGYWNEYSFRLDKLITKNNIKYINIDFKTQFLRSYIKAPYSLHRKYDRIVLPLTAMFKGNNQIDLNQSWWRKYVEPKNINKHLIHKWSSE